jgi:hypothetical protein
MGPSETVEIPRNGAFRNFGISKGWGLQKLEIPRDGAFSLFRNRGFKRIFKFFWLCMLESHKKSRSPTIRDRSLFIP